MISDVIKEEISLTKLYCGFFGATALAFISWIIDHLDASQNILIIYSIISVASLSANFFLVSKIKRLILKLEH